MCSEKLYANDRAERVGVSADDPDHQHQETAVAARGIRYPDKYEHERGSIFRLLRKTPVRHRSQLHQACHGANSEREGVSDSMLVTAGWISSD